MVQGVGFGVGIWFMVHGLRFMVYGVLFRV